MAQAAALQIDRQDTLISTMMDALSEISANSERAHSNLRHFADTYTQPSRQYHNLDHIDVLCKPLGHETEQKASLFKALNIEISDPPSQPEKHLNALKKIAALGHDCVYFAADGNLGPCGQFLENTYLESTTDSSKGRASVRDPHNDSLWPSPEQQQISQLVHRLFGVTEENRAALTQKNEFLSALATAEMLRQAGTPLAEIAGVTAMIEGTIPFDKPGHFVELKARLSKANEDFDLGLSEETTQQYTTLATQFANQDVGNFRGDLATFIHNTKKLVPELNATFQHKNPTASEYLATLQGDIGFLQWLKDSVEDKSVAIFQQDRSPESGEVYPSDEELEIMKEQAVENLDKTLMYLKAKTMPAALLTCITSRLGMQDLKIRELVPEPSELPSTVNRTDHDDLYFDVYQFLKKGTGYGEVTTGSSRFDIDESPITAYMWETLGERELYKAYFKLSPQMKLLSSNLDSVVPLDRCIESFKKHLPPEVIDTVYNHLAEKITPDTPQMSSHKDVLEAHKQRFVMPANGPQVAVIGR